MKLTRGAVAVFVLAGIAAAAHAQSGKTREDVLRELAEARRVGDIVIAGCGGGTLREAFPNRYPASSVAATPRDAPDAPRSEATMSRSTQNAGPDARR